MGRARGSRAYRSLQCRHEVGAVDGDERRGDDDHAGDRERVVLEYRAADVAGNVSGMRQFDVPPGLRIARRVRRRERCVDQR